MVQRVCVLHSFLWLSHIALRGQSTFCVSTGWTFGLSPSFGYCEQYCCEHSCTGFCCSPVFQLFGVRDPGPFIPSLHCLPNVAMLRVTLSLKHTGRQMYPISSRRISRVVVRIAHEVAPILRKRPVSQLLQAAWKAPVSFIQQEVEAFPLGHSARLRADSSFTPNTPVTDPHPNTQRDQVQNLRALFLLQTAS